MVIGTRFVGVAGSGQDASLAALRRRVPRYRASATLEGGAAAGLIRGTLQREFQAQPQHLRAPQFFTPGFAPLDWKSICGGAAPFVGKLLRFIPPLI